MESKFNKFPTDVYLKTKSLPLLRSGPLPFTRPRAAMVFTYTSEDLSK